MPFVRQSHPGSSGRRSISGFMRKRAAAVRIQRAFRRRKRKGPSVSVIKSPSAFSDITKVKLRYAFQTQLQDAVGGTVASWVLRGNSVNDPNYTGAGHQPMGHDQWSAFYKKYLVLASACKCTFVNNTTTPTYVSLMLKTQSSSTTSLGAQSERGYVRSTILGGTSGSRDQRQLRNYSSTSRALGLTGKLSTDDGEEYGALVSSNPNSQWYWHVNSVALDETSTSDIRVLIELKYYVLYYDRQPLGQS